MINIDDRLLDMVTPDELYLLCRIASHLGSDGSCFPSNRRLQQLTGFKERHLLRQKKSLQDKKIIASEFRFRDDRTQGSSKYTVETDLIGVFVSVRKLSHQTPYTVSEDTPQGVTPDTLPLSHQTPREVLDSFLSINQSKVLDNLVEKEFSTVIHDQIEETEITLHDDLASVQDNAELDVDVKEKPTKEKPPRKVTTKARAKVEDPTPIDAMWQIVLDQCKRIGNPEPEFDKRYLRDFKMLYVKLKGRAERMNEPIPNPSEPFRRYCLKIANFIIEGRKNSATRFDANRFAQNFNPGFMHNSFNSICATIQAGVTQGKPIQPTRYDEKEVYANYDSSQAAF